MERLKAFIVDFIIIIFIFTLVFIAMLVDIKSFESPKQSTAAKEASNYLQKDKKDIEAISEVLVKEQKELQDMKSSMEASKGENKVEDWNDIVINYNKKYADYEKKLEEYNKKVEEYNKKYSQYKILGNKNENVFQWVKSVLGID